MKRLLPLVFICIFSVSVLAGGPAIPGGKWKTSNSQVIPKDTTKNVRVPTRIIVGDSSTATARISVQGAAPTIYIRSLSSDPSLFFSEGDSDKWQLAYSTSGNFFRIRTSGVKDRIKITDAGLITFNEVYSIPSVDGIVNQVMTTNGAGVVSWATPPGAAGGTTDSIGFSFGDTTKYQVDKALKISMGAGLLNTPIADSSGVDTTTLSVNFLWSFVDSTTTTLAADSSGDSLITIDETATTTDFSTEKSAGFIFNEVVSFSDSVGVGIAAPTADFDIQGSESAGIVKLRVANTDNSSTASSSQLWLEVAGTSAGDPFIVFDISGSRQWAIGTDNTNDDRWALSRSGTVGTNNVLVADSNGNVIKSTLGDFYLGATSETIVADSQVMTKGYIDNPTMNNLFSSGHFSKQFFDTTTSRVDPLDSIIIADNAIAEAHIDWGTGAGKVSINDIPSGNWRIWAADGSGVINDISFGPSGAALVSRGPTTLVTWSQTIDTSLVLAQTAGAATKVFLRGDSLFTIQNSDTGFVFKNDGSGNSLITVGLEGDGTATTLRVKVDTVDINGDVIMDFTGTNLSVTAGVLNASGGGSGAFDDITGDTARYIGPNADTALIVTSNGTGDTRITVGKESDGTATTLSVEVDTLLLGGSVYTNLAGTGITLSAGAISADLGTDIVTGEIVDQTITSADIDSTASNVPFASAYHITSAVADSAYVTANTINDTAAALRNGDTWTGAHDFGGASDFELPNGANPTTNAAGEIAIDSDDDAIEVYDGTRSVLMPMHKTISVTIWEPDLITDTVPIFYVDSTLYPGGITMTKAELHTSVDGAYTLTLIDFTAADPPVVGAVMNSLVVGASDQRVQDATFTDATLAVGEFIYINTPSTNIDWIRLSITFFVIDNN